MKTYSALYGLCDALACQWDESPETLNVNDVTALVLACHEVDAEHYHYLPTVQAIVEADCVIPEDISEYIPKAREIADELAGSDKQYTYQENGDEWDILGVTLAGDEDRVGTVQTETLAQKMIESLSPPAPVQTMSVMDVCLPDIIGAYDTPDNCPEWEFVEEVSSYTHKRNNKSGIWEFMVNMTVIDMDERCGAIPEKLKQVFEQAKSLGCGYVLFHQGT